MGIKKTEWETEKWEAEKVDQLDDPTF